MKSIEDKLINSDKLSVPNHHKILCGKMYRHGTFMDIFLAAARNCIRSSQEPVYFFNHRTHQHVISRSIILLSVDETVV